MSKICRIILPGTPGDVLSEWSSCLNQIHGSGIAGHKPVRLNVFIDQPDYGTFLKTRERILSSVFNFFGNECPAVSIIIQPPGKPLNTAVEVTYRSSDSFVFRYNNFSGIPYVTLESEDYKEIWAGGISSYTFPDDTGKEADGAFSLMKSVLEKEGMSMNHVVRQWNYIGNILGIRNGQQNYQKFNEVRNIYYTKFRSVKGYPAATGVGMKHGGVVLDFYAVKAGKDFSIIPVSNPDQVNAYEYSQLVLKGNDEHGKKVKHPPQFERALMVTHGSNRWLHISGTASVLGQETIGIEDIEKQCDVAVRNVLKVSDPSRLSHLVSGTETLQENFLLIRVYIKRQSDFGVVAEKCRIQFRDIPAIFVEADLCRDDLLMELEAEAVIK